jgi:hypothetical protein
MVNYFYFLKILFINISIDQSKPNLLISFDDNIILYNILDNTEEYSLKEFSIINIEKTHHFNHIQYDPYQLFVIYYDQNQHTILWFVYLFNLF